MLDQKQIDQMMRDLEQDPNPIFIEEIYKEPEPVVPDFFSIFKALFGFKS